MRFPRNAFCVCLSESADPDYSATTQSGVFGNLTADGQYNEADQKVADAMQWAWTTFARTGVPRSDGNGWPAFEAGAPEYMLIKDELSPRPYAVDELMTVISSMRGFWENLGARKGG